MTRSALLFAAALAGCDLTPRSAVESDAGIAGEKSAVPLAPPSRSTRATASPPGRSLIAERLVLAEWSRAENRAVCAPVSFGSDGGEGGTPRRANFGGGWAVAFDLPDRRSAYGIAGTGILPQDSASVSAQREALLGQWPSFRDLPALPQPAFAGYGIEGAQPWPEDNPQGFGANGLAYVRIAGSSCLYNVWSRLGRAHLETLLDSLRVVAATRGT